MSTLIPNFFVFSYVSLQFIIFEATFKKPLKSTELCLWKTGLYNLGLVLFLFFCVSFFALPFISFPLRSSFFFFPCIILIISIFFFLIPFFVHREFVALNTYIAMCYYKLDYYDVSLEILDGYVILICDLYKSFFLFLSHRSIFPVYVAQFLAPS